MTRNLLLSAISLVRMRSAEAFGRSVLVFITRILGDHLGRLGLAGQVASADAAALLDVALDLDTGRFVSVFTFGQHGRSWL
jgi:hypothetical protein